ncbi:hypothetical protein BC937DRAFT_92583 [Endogone sp. FLAS-F59071]|nr:hypothetical protein BC937DRAFT_92583 [Endogone sp. FLAS-F59071]|eukprot:RUS23088.1 hypothetical protein BC937DRAFT_92583 [Endogone sp. FLAS-F59071]
MATAPPKTSQFSHTKHPKTKSNMSQFKTVLVAGGTGGLGAFIVDELVANGSYTVKILARPSSEANKPAAIEKYKAIGVEVVAADYNDHAALVKALKGVDVVTSTVGAEGLSDSQLALIKASEEAGVKRFIPSEFGSDTNKVKFPLFAHKVQVADYLRNSNLEYTLFFTGFFTDTLTDFAGWDLKNGKAVIIGTGDEQFTSTHRKDIAKFVVASLSNPKSRNTVHGTASFVSTWKDWIAAAEKQLGRKFEVTYRDLPTVEAELAATKGITYEFVRDTILSIPAKGFGVIEKEVTIEYPDIKTITLEEYFQDRYSKA